MVNQREAYDLNSSDQHDQNNDQWLIKLSITKLVTYPEMTRKARVDVAAGKLDLKNY